MLAVCIFPGLWCTGDKKDDSLTDLLKQADDILTDLSQADYDVVGVDVAEGGVVAALSPRLVQHQVPAVH